MPDDHVVLCGRYELRDRIGGGGMGEVYAGYDRRLDREVAVKVMHAAAGSRDRRRFEIESRMAARLVHPNIVSVFDSGEADGEPFLVMERLPGQTLAHRLARGPLSPPEASQLGMEVLGALDAAHATGMVHRDVKPANILATVDRHWKVADFGIARTADETLTSTGLVVGTLAYLAPERVAGGPATVQTDLYATGAVLYEALCGRRPVDPGAPPAAYLDPHPTPLDEVRPGLPPGLVAAVETAMATEPARRFASAAAMAAALHSVGDRTVATPSVAASGPPTVAIPTPRPAPALARVTGTRILAVAAALAIATGIVVLATRTPHHSPPAATTPTTAVTTPPASTLTPGLDDALRRLQQAVKP